MGLLVETIIVGVGAWFLCRAAFRSWRERGAEPPPEPGAHDAGVWVNETRWARIVDALELEEELKDGDQDGQPGRGRKE
jgi:hypothetical protein